MYQQSETDQNSIQNSSQDHLLFGPTQDLFNNLSTSIIEQENLNYNIQSECNKIQKAISKQDNNQHLQKIASSKRKYKKKIYCLVQNRIQGALSPKQTIPICSGLYISEDGIIRFCYSISQFCFGYQQGSTQFVEENLDLGIIDIRVQSFLKQDQCPVEEALKHVQFIPDQLYHNLAEKMVQFNNIHVQVKEQVNKAQLSQQIFDQKDEEFLIFKKKCFEVLKEYGENNPYQMYQYAIGRFNYNKQDFEFSQVGFSQTYLQLIGLDTNSFTQMLLRHQRVDLINRQGILDLSLKGLTSIVNCSGNDTYLCHIKTFDGFPIKVYQKKRKMNVPMYDNCLLPNINDFTLSFTEFDVDVEDLQNLIAYRQKMLQRSNNLTLNEYINKELSYFFEDVEYSCHSYTFIEKYYEENLKYLIKKENKMQEQKQCHFRYINNQF